MKDGRRGAASSPRCRAFDKIRSRWSLAAEVSKIHEHVNPDRPTGSWTSSPTRLTHGLFRVGVRKLWLSSRLRFFEFGGSYRSIDKNFGFFSEFDF